MLKELSELNIDISVVLTKADKIPDEHVYNKMLMFSNLLNKRYLNINPLLHTVSSKTKFGIDMLKHSLIEAFEVKEPRNVDGDETTVIKYLLSQKSEPKLNINEILRKNKKKELKLE